MLETYTYTGTYCTGLAVCVISIDTYIQLQHAQLFKARIMVSVLRRLITRLFLGPAVSTTWQ